MSKSLESSFHAVVLSITIVIMAEVMRFLLERPDADELEKTLSIGISVISGLGLYEAICSIVEFTLERSERIKRSILGSSYVEGKWYGYYTYEYVDNQGQTFVVVYLLIENISQEWENVSLNGRAFDRNGNPHGQWSSINARAYGDRSQLEIRSVANLSGRHYDSARTMQLEGHPPDHMCGYVLDTVASNRPDMAWWEAWKSEKPITDAEALGEAERKYQQFLSTHTALNSVAKRASAAAGNQVPQSLP